MEKSKTNRINRIIFITSAIIVALLFAWLSWRLYWLETGATKQTLWHEFDLSRINNLKGCLQHGDTECPEGKYADSQSALERISAYDKTLLFSNQPPK